jgi:predicted acyl esterase
MKQSTRRILPALVLAVLSAPLVAQRGGGMTQEQQDLRWQREREIQEIAVVERKVMMPMRDGVRLATDIYRPKNAAGPVPVDLREDPLQLQLLGRPQPRAAPT